MLVSRLSVVVLLLLGLTLFAYGQEQQPPYLVWGASPTCGAKNLSQDSGPLHCWRTVTGDLETYHVKHGKLSISLRYWWYASHIRILTEVENGHDESIPVTVKTWFVEGYESFAAFNANGKALFLSEAKSPDDGIGLPGRVPVGIPSVSGTLPDGGADPERSIAPIPVVAENKRPSALKWKEIRPRSKQSGQLRFDANSKARYLRITLKLNGTNYIYSLEKP